jgi:dihydroflavonol-4-reductase
MKTVLVTGGTGLVGFNIIQSLLKRNYQVKALVRDLEKGQRLLPKQCNLVQGDICEPESLQSALKDCHWVFHAAGFPEQWMKNDDTFQKVNVQGTANMIEAALNAKVERFIHTSTIDVFEGITGKEYDESTIDPNPKGTLYERSKQQADQLVVAALEKGLPAIFLHPAGLFGPGPTDSPGMNDFFVKLKNKQVPMLLPGGLPLVYGPDVGEGHVLAAEQAGNGERFILCESYSSLTNLAQTALQKINPSLKTPPVMPLGVAKLVSVLGEGLANLINKAPLVPKGQLHFLQWQAIPVSHKAQQQLGWKTTPFEDALQNTLDFLIKE